uniref:Uncharacterized protein n=1 Tax=Anopheles stephensi TaxID=30069 RepID=A0A182YQU7_ANOST
FTTSKIPRITVKCSSVTLIHGTIIAADVVRYNTKATYHGTVLQLDEVNDFKKVAMFKEKKVNFQTYQQEERKTAKIVLHGLIDLQISEVIDILKEENVEPSQLPGTISQQSPARCNAKGANYSDTVQQTAIVSKGVNYAQANPNY